MSTYKVYYSIEGSNTEETIVNFDTTASDLISKVAPSSSRQLFVFHCQILLDRNKLLKDCCDPLYFYITSKKENGSLASIRTGVRSMKSMDSRSACMRNDSAFNIFNPIFRVYVNSTFQSMLEPQQISIKLQSNYQEICQIIKSHFNFSNDYNLILLLPGGFPLIDISEPLLTFFSEMENWDRSPPIYAVIYRDNIDLNQQITEPCNYQNYRNILSPLFDSSDSGLSQIASFLGYLYHCGIDSEDFFKVFSDLIPFPPLLINLYRCLNSFSLQARDIICITSSLQAYLHAVLPTVPHQQVFTYLLTMLTYCRHNILGHTKRLPNYEYIRIFDQSYEDLFFNGINKIYDHKFEQLQQPFIFCISDFSHSVFSPLSIQPDLNDFKSAWKSCSLYHPISPQSFPFPPDQFKGYYPMFLSGSQPGQVMLYLTKVSEDKIRYIDSSNGRQLESTIQFQNDLFPLVDSNRIDQLVYFYLDLSISMKWNLIGKSKPPKSRIEIAKSFITSFVNQTNNFRIPTLYGLIVFNSHGVEEICAPTSNPSQLIESLNNLKPAGTTALWNALRTTIQKIQYSCKSKRIIILSAGQNTESEQASNELINQFIQNNIIVDSFVCSLIQMDDEHSACRIFSHRTGGLCINPQSEIDGLAYFERETFLNINKRITLYNEKNEFDNLSIPNIDLLRGNQKARRKPLNELMNKFSFRKYISRREQRVFTELKTLPSFKDIFIYLREGSFDECSLFFKGPHGTIYESVWLHLILTFPLDYPTVPPVFRFMTIPFHPNVSVEGLIMFSKLGSGYHPSVTIAEIIFAIIELLQNPELDGFIINPDAMKQDKVTALDSSFYNNYHDYMPDPDIEKATTFRTKEIKPHCFDCDVLID